MRQGENVTLAAPGRERDARVTRAAAYECVGAGSRAWSRQPGVEPAEKARRFAEPMASSSYAGAWMRVAAACVRKGDHQRAGRDDDHRRL